MRKAEKVRSFCRRLLSVFVLRKQRWTEIRKKVSKYHKQFAGLLRGTALSFILLLVLVALLARATNASAIKLLELAVLIWGVVFGVFMQELLSFVIVPDKDVLHPLRNEALFAEMLGALDEFAKKVSEDEDLGRLDDEQTEIYILLSSPLLLAPDEVDKVLNDETYQTRYEVLLNTIFSAKQKFKKHIVCLSMAPSRRFGVSPWERFLKTFAGFVISNNKRSKIDERAEEDAFYEDLDTFRRNLMHCVRRFCGHDHIRPNLLFADQDDLQWQAVVIRAPQLRFYKAVVGFYGEDFFQAYSRLGLMSKLMTNDNDNDKRNPDNQGFVSDEPDIVDWVVSGLVHPYTSRAEHCGTDSAHHSVGIHDRIAKVLPSIEGGDSEEPAFVDDLAQFRSLALHYAHGPKALVRKIDYPIFPVCKDEKVRVRSLCYCQHLFHPLIAESSLWSSNNIRVPGEGRVLDMCTGIGVQGLAAIDRGARLVHAVDQDPIALLCAAENLRAAVETAERNVDVVLTLAKGVKSSPVDKFEELFNDCLNSELWRDLMTNTWRHNAQDLYERNIEWLKQHYSEEIEQVSFDLVILEPPFVEFSSELITPSHASLYDLHFKACRTLLDVSPSLLVSVDADTPMWERPYILQSFSSLESTDELERYIGSLELSIYRKHCIMKNGVHWYAYHLTPILQKTRHNPLHAVASVDQ